MFFFKLASFGVLMAENKVKLRERVINEKSVGSIVYGTPWFRDR